MKCSALDGFPLRFYKLLSSTLSLILAKTFNSVDQLHPLLPDMFTTHISLIPELDKDPSVCNNYKPISLLNIDIIIYAKALAIRLFSLLPQLTYGDQVGLIPGREARDNTAKTIHLVSQVQRSTLNYILSIDAEKAFDRISWQFLWLSLSLYARPRAKLLIISLLFDSFTISNRKKQGCPLSTFLFAIVI